MNKKRAAQRYELIRVRAGVYRVGFTHAVIWQGDDKLWWWFTREGGLSGKARTVTLAHRAIVKAATTTDPPISASMHSDVVLGLVMAQLVEISKRYKGKSPCAKEVDQLLGNLV